jgi:hypothetical protein
MTIDQLLTNANPEYFGPHGEQLLKVAEIKIQQEQILSSEKASIQLAKLTSSLKWATWALVFFTAVQALIALAALFNWSFFTAVQALIALAALFK